MPTEALSIEELTLSDRIVSLLHAGGVTHVAQLEAMSDDELDAISGIGPSFIAEIREAIANLPPVTDGPENLPEDDYEMVDEAGLTEADKATLTDMPSPVAERLEMAIAALQKIHAIHLAQDQAKGKNKPSNITSWLQSVIDDVS